MKPIEYVAEGFIVKWIEDKQAPLNRSETGYGPKIPSRYRVKCSDNRTRRIYAVCYSNAASHYVIVNGRALYIRDSDFPI
jgi:hypothetical protein